MIAMCRTKKLLGLPFRRMLLLIGLLAFFVSSKRAEARLLEIYADGYLGGMYGTEPKFNSRVTPQGTDFFHDQSGGLLGLRAGVEVLYTDIYLQFDQFMTPRGFSGSTLQAMVGWDFGLGSGDWTGTLGGYGGLVFGFPYTPHPPIDNDQIATIGVALEGQGGAEYNINRFLAVQMIATLGYHYMFAGAHPVLFNESGMSASTQTHGFHLMLKAGIRFHIGL